MSYSSVTGAAVTLRNERVLRYVTEGTVGILESVCSRKARGLRPNTMDKSTHWQIVNATLDHFMRDRVEWMLSNAAGNRGI